MSNEITVTLLFADRGEFHSEKVRIPGEGLERHERLIDFLREDPAARRRLTIDLKRLVCARVEND